MVPDLKSKLKEAMTLGKKNTPKSSKYFPKLVQFHCVKDAKMEKTPPQNVSIIYTVFLVLGEWKKSHKIQLRNAKGMTRKEIWGAGLGSGKGWTREQSIKLYFF